MAGSMGRSRDSWHRPSQDVSLDDLADQFPPENTPRHWYKGGAHGKDVLVLWTR